MPDFTGVHFALMGGNLIAGTAIGWFARTITFEKSRGSAVPPADTETVLDVLAGVTKNTTDSSSNLRSLETKVLAGENRTDETLIAEIRLFGRSYAEQMESDVPRVNRIAEKSEDVLRDVVKELVRHTSNVAKFNHTVGDDIERCVPANVREILSIAISNLLDCNRHLERQLNEARRELTRKRAELNDARRDARIDSLTKLHNRRAFEERLKGIHANFLRTEKHYTVVMFDLDHFKETNDTHGHSAGDVVLQVFAKVLTDAIRSDDVAARIGGEEFALLLDDAGEQEALQIADRIRRHASTKIVRMNNNQITFTVSAGIAEVAAGDTTEQVMKRADLALYQAKREGRNCVRLCNADAENESHDTEAALTI